MLFTLLLVALGQWSHKEGDPLPHEEGYLVQPFSKAEWQASNFAKAEAVEAWRKLKFGMFIHFGLSTHDNADLSWQTVQTRKLPDQGHGAVPDDVWQKYPNDLKFEGFSAEEWVKIAVDSGCKYLVVVAKHHQGFHLWDTGQSEFKITNTPFGRDYLKELAVASEKAGLPFGIYYSQRDWYQPNYGPVDPARSVKLFNYTWKPKPGYNVTFNDTHRKYIEYQYRAVRQLCTRYGNLSVFWWDSVWWGGMFVENMWDAENLTRMVRALQPNILENNRCSVPGDFDTPEQTLASFQDWRPWESCITLSTTWSYSGRPIKSLESIVRLLVTNACNDGNLLLSWGPQWSGKFADNQKQRFLEVGSWLKRFGDTIYGTRGGPWRSGAFGGATKRGNRVWVHILNMTGEQLVLPGISGLKVLSAKLFNDGGSLQFSQSESQLSVTVPKARQDPLDSIVEFELSQPADTLNFTA